MRHLITSLLIIALVFTGCNKQPSQQEAELQKLLDQQSELQHTQEESLDRLEHLKDSLSGERNELLEEKADKNEQIKKLENNQKSLVDKIKEEEASLVAEEKDQLQKDIDSYQDSIEQLKQEVAGIGVNIDSVEKSLEFYDLQQGQAEKVLESGITDIDNRLSKLEQQKRQEIKRRDLLGKRTQIIDKKIEAVSMEKQLYEDELDELQRMNASESDMEPYREKMAELDSIIADHKENKQSLEEERKGISSWIADVNEMMANLESQIDQEYDRKEIIEEFIRAEKNRLSNELTSLQDSRSGLVEEQENLSRKLAQTEKNIASLDKRIELIRNKEMSEVLEQQVAIEQTDAALSEQEIGLLEESSQTGTESASAITSEADAELRNILQLSNELDSLKASIQEEKMEIAKTRMELSQKRAEAAEKRAALTRTAGYILLIIIIGGLGIISLFYYLGRRSRRPAAQ